ncbi:MAG: hypothetical protein A2W20_04450 [Candidatus Aminicenantes bacterium RBG_16_66_30]|nr:MAG: hypothetical protein A2W20_04450 [Candidatus Aminicenantes bacterium RBG_16_66_30]
MAKRAERGLSRRGFLKGTAVGLGAVGLAAAAPAWMVASSGHTAPQAVSKEDALPPSGSLVAFVRDATKGEVVIMVGSKEVVRKDLALVSHLASAAG